MEFINKLPYLKHKYNSFLRSIMFRITHEENYSIVTDFHIKNNCKKIFFEKNIVTLQGFSDSKYEFDKIYLRRNSSDLFVFNQIFIQKEYDTLFDVYKNNFEKNDTPVTIIDLGGNIGLTSIYAAMHFKSSEIIVVEPSESNFEILTKNCESITNQNPNVNFTLINSGVWKNTCKLSIADDSVDGWAIQVYEDINGTIDAISMNDLVKKMPEIDILKIDIEGTEFVIVNEEVNCDWLSNVKIIAIEIHRKLGNVEAICKTITSKGFVYCGKVSETFIFIKK